MKMQLPVTLKVQAAFGSVMALLLIVGIVAYRSILASSESARWAQHTNEVLEHLANLRLGAENIESGYRDFALSGDDAFLQWSRANTSLADNEQRTLRALTTDNPRQQGRLSLITDLLRRIVERGDSIVGSRRAPAAADAPALIRSGQDDVLLDAFRGATRDIEAEEQQLLRERNSFAVNRDREARVALIVGIALALLIAAVSGWRVAGDQTKRKGA
jgi:methyl-accepting chemotaxis protein